MVRREMPQQAAGGNMVMVGGGNNAASTYVNGEELKQVSVPVETLLGAANGATTGILASAAISAIVSAAEHFRGGNDLQGVGSFVIKNLTSKTHLGAIIGGTAIFAALGALVRNSRATKHNEWSDRQYAALERETVSHASRVEKSVAEGLQPQNLTRAKKFSDQVDQQREQGSYDPFNYPNSI